MYNGSSKHFSTIFHPKKFRYKDKKPLNFIIVCLFFPKYLGLISNDWYACSRCCSVICWSILIDYGVFHWILDEIFRKNILNPNKSLIILNNSVWNISDQELLTSLFFNTVHGCFLKTKLILKLNKSFTFYQNLIQK